MEKEILKKNSRGFTRLVDFGDAILSRTKSASPKLTTGFTIIETMIAISLFLIIVTVGMGSLMSATSLSRKSQDARSIMDNLSFIMEDISRNLRTGFSYHCVDNGIYSATTPYSCAFGQGISFKSAYGNQWVYKIESLDGGITYNISKSVDGGTTWTVLNTSEISLDSNSGFIVTGAEPPPGNTIQPFVIIKLSGKIVSKEITTPFSLETGVSQRLTDITP